MNKGEVYFGLYGNGYDPEELTRDIGIQPTSIKREAIPIPKYTCWKVTSGIIEDEVIDVYEMAAQLVLLLEPFASQIATAKQKYLLNAVFQVVLYIGNDESRSTPAIGFDSRVIAFLHHVGATIDIDTYISSA